MDTYKELKNRLLEHEKEYQRILTAFECSPMNAATAQDLKSSLSSFVDRLTESDTIFRDIRFEVDFLPEHYAVRITPKYGKTE